MDIRDFARYLTKLDRTKAPRYSRTSNIAIWLTDILHDIPGSASDSVLMRGDDELGYATWSGEVFWAAETKWGLEAKAINTTRGYIDFPSLGIAQNGTATYEFFMTVGTPAGSRGAVNWVFDQFLYQSQSDNRFYFTGTSDYFNWTPTTGTKYHVTLKTQGVTGNATLTINAAAPVSCTQGAGTHNVPAFTNRIGSSGTPYGMAGTIDELRIYKNRLLGTAEISYNYFEGYGVSAPYSEANIALWYHGNKRGSLIRDYSTASYHGTPFQSLSVIDVTPLHGEVTQQNMMVAGFSPLGGF